MGRGSALLHTTLCPNVVTRNLASALVCLQHAVALICGRWGEAKLSFVICFTHSAASPHSQSGPRLDRDMNQRMDGDEAENGEILNLIPILIFIADIENDSPCD